MQEKLDSISDKELIEIANAELDKLCLSRGESFKMSIPLRIDDTDVIFSEIIKRFEILCSLKK
jgi:hypothetical protein